MSVKAPAKINSPAKSPLLERFVALVKFGIDSWEEAGRVLVKLCERAGAIADVEKATGIPFAILAIFLRIGRKELLPLLLVNPSPGAMRLAKMPYAVQERLCNAEIHVEHLERSMGLHCLSASEAKIAIGENGVNPPSVQREILRTMRVQKERRLRSSPRETPAVNVSHRIVANGYEDDLNQTLQIAPKNEPAMEETDESSALDECLRVAQNALIAARVKMREQELPAGLDAYIASALGAVGNLRFKIKGGD